MNRFRLNSGGKQQLWWLLWLFPYLFFSVAADGLHNHPLVPGWSPTSLQGARTVRATQPGERDAGHTDQDDDNCIACQWNSMASAMVSLCAVVTPPSHYSADIPLTGFSASPCNPFIRAGRVPPSL